METFSLPLFVFVFISSAMAACEINGVTYVCTDISEIPTSLPNGITFLLVKDSPNLLHISFLPESLISLSLNNVGVTDFQAEAISNVADTLSELRIADANSIQTLDLGKPATSSETALTNLVVMRCRMLSAFDNIPQYRNLRSITLTTTNIQSIESNMLEGLDSVTYLDISYNEKLSFIHQNAFKDMPRLNTLNMNNCDLRKLYGNYFDLPYEKGYLKSVNALANDYKCDQMCDFMSWYWGHTGFFYIALIGKCSTSGYNLAVYDLSRYQAGCVPVFWIVFGSIMGALILIAMVMCVITLVCDINYKDYCCCWRGSRRNRSNSFSGNTNQTEVDTYYIDVINPTKPQVPAYHDSPPAYHESPMSASTSASSPPVVHDDVQNSALTTPQCTTDIAPDVIPDVLPSLETTLPLSPSVQGDSTPSDAQGPFLSSSSSESL